MSSRPEQGEAPPLGEGMLAQIERFAIDVAREAGAQLLRYFAAPLDVRFKSKRDKDPVTQADEAIEALVRRSVAGRFPDHGVLGEEGVDAAAGAEFLWVVDPLDGTANFANGLPIFAVSIGVLRFGEPVAAALYTTFGPDARPCVMHARRGGGLGIDGRPWLPASPAFSGRARLSGVPAGFHHGFHFRLSKGMPPGETRSLGSIAVELGLAASGGLQYALFGSPRIWDVAAGVLLVQEAGGAVFTDQNGRWRRLTRFERPPGRPLRDWRQAVIAGDARLLGKVLGRTRVRHTPLQLAERLAGPVWTARAYQSARRSCPLIRRAWTVASAIAGRFRAH